MDLILVHIGDKLPPYIGDCISQAKKVSDCEIILAASSGIADLPAGVNVLPIGSIPKTENMILFERCPYFSEWKSNTDIFWKYACERLFVVEGVMRALGIKEALHIENDNLIYGQPDTAYLRSVVGESVGLTEITETLLSAGVMYVGGLESLKELNLRLVTLMNMGEAALNARYGAEMMHEMRMMKIATQSDRKIVELLPIFPDAKSKYVYDGASWGQYVGGTFQHPGEPYAHESHLVGREIIKKRYAVQWDEVSNLPTVVDTKTGTAKRIFNLHIHSKKLERWKT